MAINVKEYLETLAKDAGLDDATKAAVLKASENEKFGKKLGEELMTRSDYSRSMDEVAKERAAIETGKAENKRISNWYAKAFPEWEEATKAKAQLQAQLQTYVNTYGPLDGVTSAETTPANNTVPANGDYLTKADLQKQLAQLNEQAVATAAGIVSESVPLALEHFQKTGKILDFNSLLEKAKVVANTPISPLRRAYEELTRADMDTLNVAARQKELDQVKADAIRDWQSTHNIPIDTSPRAPSTIGAYLAADRTKAPTGDDAKMAAFMSALNSEEALAAREKA